MRTILFIGLALCIQGSAIAQDVTPDPTAPATSQQPAPSKKIAKILAKGDGLTRETAYTVSSVNQEYEILRYLGLKPISQSLVMDKKAFDQFTAVDEITGEERNVWFDISKFFGRMF